MAFGLSFSEDFFLDGNPDLVQPSLRPTSVYQAIVSLQAEAWDRLAREVFFVDPERLDPLTVPDAVRHTDTCSNLDTPVRVWIDREGWHALLVYDRPAS